MNDFKVTIVNKTNGSNFHIDLIYEPEENNEIDFGFGNSSNSIERDDLEFLDANHLVIKPVGYTIKNPIKREKKRIKISKTNPFIYEVKGEIVFYEEKVHLKLISAEYLLEKNKQYYIQLVYKDKVSEKIEIQF